jgi:hypothetical protein
MQKQSWAKESSATRATVNPSGRANGNSSLTAFDVETTEIDKQMTVSQQVFHQTVNKAVVGPGAKKFAWEVIVCELEARSEEDSREETGRSVESDMMNRAETSEAKDSG